MLEDDLSPAVLRALVAADVSAERQKAVAALPGHLLVALLDQVESHAVAALRAGAVDVEELGALLQSEDPAASWPAMGGPTVAGIVGRARQLAVASGRFEQASGEDVLIAILEVWMPARELVAQAGGDVDAIVAGYHARRQPDLSPLATGAVEWSVADRREETDVARILDANANRAREALRVLEDFCRFVRDDAVLTERIKDARHRLRDAIAPLDGGRLTIARQTAADVGTHIGAFDESIRTSLTDVVSANAKRAQEALRTLEEYAKLESPDAAAKLERLRYELYEIDQLLAVGMRANERLAGALLYWLADPNACRSSFAWTVQEALAGGVQIVQLRDKSAEDRELVQTARELRAWTKSAGAMFVVNDCPDICRIVHADGVHLGQTDLSLKDARRIVGPDALIGVSTHDIVQAQKAVDDGADYLGVGPTFPSKSKTFDSFPGVDFVREVAPSIRIPWFCIGGVDETNVAEVVAAGGTRIAVGAAISAADDPAQAARSLRARLRL